MASRRNSGGGEAGRAHPGDSFGGATNRDGTSHRDAFTGGANHSGAHPGDECAGGAGRNGDHRRDTAFGTAERGDARRGGAGRGRVCHDGVDHNGARPGDTGRCRRAARHRGGSRLRIRLRKRTMSDGAHVELAADRPAAAVRISRRPLWRIRVARGWPRYVLYTVALAGLLASARVALDPSRAALPASLLRGARSEDLAAEGFATLFARAYLSWEAQHPEARERALEPFIGSGMDADAGLQPPPDSEQRVEWTQVVQQRQPLPGEEVYTVAAATDASGLLYLTVSVVRAPSGALALAGYPALVGPPASGPAQPQAGGHLREVSEPALATVVERALRNYLAGSPSELAADLAPGAQVSPPGIELALQSLQSLQWAPGGGAVIALAQAQDQHGAQYTLAYELDVLRAQGRWEIAAIQMDPDTDT